MNPDAVAGFENSQLLRPAAIYRRAILSFPRASGQIERGRLGARDLWR